MSAQSVAVDLTPGGVLSQTEIRVTGTDGSTVNGPITRPT